MAMQFKQVEHGLYTLDVTGYVCPHPQLYTKKVMEKLHRATSLSWFLTTPLQQSPALPCAQMRATRFSIKRGMGLNSSSQFKKLNKIMLDTFLGSKTNEAF